MDVDASRPLPGLAQLPRRPLTVDEYHRMGEAGILTEDDHVELIEGELLVVTPIGPPHSGTVIALTDLFSEAVRGRGYVSVQSPVRLGDRSEPEPDIAVLGLRADRYRRALPAPEDTLLVIEVADSSLVRDSVTKKALYARHGIPELWIVDLVANEVEVCRAPVGDGYTDICRVGREWVLEPVMLPGVAIQVAAFLD
jgi:hypothetical protein